MNQAVLLMAHGAPKNLEDVEEYVLHIRHGRPLPPDQMAVIKDRYRQVGGSPLLEITHRQAKALEGRLAHGPKQCRVYIGMRHSHPFIRETVEQMVADGVDSLVTLCMAPQFSRLTIGAYRQMLEEAIGGRNMPFAMVHSFARNPGLIRAFGARLAEARAAHPDSFVLFTAHSLPERVLQEGDPYD
ncbi:MAG TPA: ferrochelatase, partial [Acidobacteriota bacterium]|nr:ferrochelatase [Acidobacteriota bacterium]